MMGAFLDKPKTEKASRGEAGGGLSYGLSAMQGWRIDMEDAHTSLLTLPEPYSSWAYFGVYDGHAGGVVSEMISKKLLPTILETAQFKNLQLDESGDPVNLEEVKSGIRSGFLNIDKVIGQSREVESGEDKSGSTAVVVFITPKYIIFANCGDSRGILTRNNSVHFFTEDHKPMNPGERDRIQKAGGTVMIQRINGSLAVSRALGDFDYKKVESKGATEQLVSPEPEVTVIEREMAEDQLVVLACDGIWDVMTNEELCDFVLSRCLCVPDLSKVAEEVIDHCLYKGSRDNMSLIIVVVSQENGPKLDKELERRDQRLNDIIIEKVHEYVNSETNDLDINSLLMWLQSLSLTDLPPGGITAKRYIIDTLFEDLCRDKQKPHNNSSESNHALAVLSLLTGPGTENFKWPRRSGASEPSEIDSDNVDKSKTTK